MTMIRDMLLRDLRAIGAVGVIDGFRVHTLDDLELRTPYIGLDGRPAFLDADGRIVPLPEGWVVWRNGDGRTALHYSPGGAEISFAGRNFDGALWELEAWDYMADARKSDEYDNAPEAWAAAEAWLKSVAERAPVARDGEA